MGRDIRQEILKTAKELFNERGYNGVSTRDISEVLGISKGNLIYHFKKIDTLLLSIIYWMPFWRLKQVKISDVSFQQQAWGILYPLLTNKGRDILKDTITTF